MFYDNCLSVTQFIFGRGRPCDMHRGEARGAEEEKTGMVKYGERERESRVCVRER